MSDITLTEVRSGYNLGKINQNFEEIEDVINGDVMHLQGGNNIMRQNLDMNGKRILNLPVPVNDNEPVRVIDLKELAENGLPNLPEYLEDYQVLTAGQTTVTFTIGDTSNASIFINGIGDNGRLFAGVDYTIVSPLTIELSVSYEAGTVCSMVSNTFFSVTTSGFVRLFTSIEDVLASKSLIVGDVINLQEQINGLEVTSVWDVLNSGEATVDGDIVQQGTYNIVKRRVGSGNIYKELQTTMMQREKQVAIPFRNTTYDELLVTYSYDYLFPQALAVDSAANELFMLRGDGGGGDNTWAWIFVYDLTTGAFKTSFTTAAQWRECIIVKYIGDTRYIYTIADNDVARYNLTTLPTNKATVAPSDTYSVYGFSFLAHDGENWYVQDRYNLKNETTRTRYKIYNSDFSAQKGELILPIDSMGTINDYINDFPKPQGMTYHNGAIMFGVGGIYIDQEPYISNADRPLYLQGLHSFTTTGEKLGTGLSEPVSHLAKMSELSGYTNSLCENQGISSSGGVLYAQWITLGPSSPDADVDKGIVITKEMTYSPRSYDFSGGQRGSRCAFNAQDFMNTCHESSFVLKNPVTFADITTFQHIIDMMNQLGLSLYTFSGTNQVITDIDSNLVPTTGNIVRVTNSNGFTFLVEIIGSIISRQYYISGAGASQVIKNITFT